MKRTVENIGLPHTDGMYMIRFAPNGNERRATMNAYMIHIEGQRWPVDVDKALGPHDMWIKMNTPYRNGVEVRKDD